MDFFEILRDRVQKRALPDTSDYRGGPFHWMMIKDEARFTDKGINATIEALKEMTIDIEEDDHGDIHYLMLTLVLEDRRKGEMKWPQKQP